jgi:hypothetical protein
MKRGLLFFTVSLLLFEPPAFGRMPELNVNAICKARSADAKMLQSIALGKGSAISLLHRDGTLLDPPAACRDDPRRRNRSHVA